MDWASFIFGAFMACVLLFGTSAFVFAVLMRREFPLWMALRAILVGFLAITFPPVGTWFFPQAEAFWTARLAATDLGIAVTGPLLATYIEPTVKAGKLRLFLWSLLPLGVLLAMSAPLAIQDPTVYRLHDFAILALVVMLISGLAWGIRRGSRAALFQAIAWVPAICTGFVALYFELVLLRYTPYYAEAMLAAFLFEFVVTAAGVGDGFMTIKRERDAAIAGVREATRASNLDPLTGIANRRGLAQRFRDPDHGRPVGIAVIDCDHFKRINDNFGHDVGDDVLVAVAEGLKGDDQFVGRLGGEEFVSLIYADDWQRMAEESRRRLTLLVRVQVQQLPFPVTASAGLAQVRESDTLESAIKRADRALYAAKDAGRNRSLLWTETEPKLVPLAHVG